MKNKEQIVKKYSDLYYAKINIEKYIKDGWYVHTCVSYNNNDIETDGILVIYEKDLQSWN